jgi:KDO2-lipid IV(A) lauroyltransferase
MAKKPRRPAVDYAVFLTVRLFVCLVQALPMALAFQIAEGVAWLAHRVDRRHRGVAADNLLHAFPELQHNPAKLDRLVRGTFRHFARVLIEIIILPRKLRVGNWRRHATGNAGKDVVRNLIRDRAQLIVTGHYGNWEVPGYMMGAFNFKMFAIARVLDNPYLERFLKRFRQATGQTVIAKKDDFDRLTEVMKRGGKVATLADQDAGPRGLFVPFFGRPASTHKAVALMAIEFDAIMTVIGVPRVGEPMHYSVICEDVIDPRDYADRPDAVRAITERYTAALERVIRRYPEQYFWLHRRWKSQPVKKAKPTPAQAQAA